MVILHLWSSSIHVQLSLITWVTICLAWCHFPSMGEKCSLITILCTACHNASVSVACIYRSVCNRLRCVYCIRMIRTVLQGYCPMPRESCMPIRLFRHSERCYSLQWHGILVWCLTLKHWIMEACAKVTRMKICTDRLSLIPYISSGFPITRFSADILLVIHFFVAK